jgi:hypothetical protein
MLEPNGRKSRKIFRRPRFTNIGNPPAFYLQQGLKNFLARKSRKSADLAAAARARLWDCAPGDYGAHVIPRALGARYELAGAVATHDSRSEGDEQNQSDGSAMGPHAQNGFRPP